MKVAQLVGVWVLALAVGVIAATLVWTTWLDTEEVVVGPGPLSDAERVWCSNNLVWVMLAAEPLGIPIPDAVAGAVAYDLSILRVLSFEYLPDGGYGVGSAAERGFRSWAGMTAGEDPSDFFPRVWATAPFDRLCRAAFEGR